MEDILKTSHVRNAQLGVTGVLFVAPDRYFQVLEGPRDAVLGLYDTISADPRHKDVSLELSEPLHHRMFGDWRMAAVSSDDLRVLSVCLAHTGARPSPDQLSGTEIWAMISDMAEAALRGDTAGVR